MYRCIQSHGITFISSPLMGTEVGSCLMKNQSWGISLFFQVSSLLNFYPWIAITLSLILHIFRFAYCSMALKKTSGSILEKSANMLNCSWNYSSSLFLKFPPFRPHPVPITYVCAYSAKEMPPGRERGGGVITSTHNLWNRGGKIEKTTISRFFASFLIKICTNHAFLCIFQPFLQFDLWNRSLNYCRLFSFYRSWANHSKFD